MKKNLLFAALAASVMVSCSNDDIVDVNHGEGIAFRASLDRALTRANATTLENMTEFNVTAIGNNANYFTDMTVTKIGDEWKPAHTYYWPGYELSFFAYTPKISGVSINNDRSEIKAFSPERKAAEQKDLLVSFNKGDKKNENNGIAMNFKHALSQIEVLAKCSNDKIKIEVLGVKMENAAAKADFTFPKEVTTADYTLPQAQWSNLQEKDDHSKAYMIKGEKNMVLTDKAQSIMFGDNNFMLIPQKQTKWDGSADTKGTYLSVLCRIYSLDGDKETLLYPRPTQDDNKNGKYAFAAVGIDIDWKPGMKYTYTLNFCGDGGGAGEIDPNPGPVDPTDPEPVDPNPGPGGEEILGKPIKFTVTVDEWKDESKDVDMK